MEKTEEKILVNSYTSSIENLKKRILDEKILNLKIENKVAIPIKKISFFNSMTNNLIIVSIVIAFVSFLLTVRPLYEVFTNPKKDELFLEYSIYKKKLSELEFINQNLLNKIKHLNDTQVQLISQNKIFNLKNSYVEDLKLEIKDQENKINNLEEIVTGLSSKTIIQQRKLIKALEMINDLENERQRIIAIIKNDNINNLELSKINF